MSDQVNKEYQATPAATLEQQIMNPNFPKNEREWWAADRIAQLEAALRELFAMCLRQTDFNDDRDGLTLDRARAALEDKCTFS